MVIGLEIHIQLKTKTKMYCSCPASFGDEPNTRTCPVCLGLPGSLPSLNKEAVRYAVLLALSTGCTVNEKSFFDRKNYFYPDLPKGYQITQQRVPIAENGIITTSDGDVFIERIHLEEEAGKSKHTADRSGTFSLVDFNRCGVPLLELVTTPSLYSPEQTTEFIKAIKSIVEYLDICDGDMEEGNLRVDANISVRKKGEKALGQRSEVKNINSFRNIRRALEYEFDRHIGILSDGGTIPFETRLFNERDGKTHPMRSKEGANDYRYFPEPDLPPLLLSPSFIEQLRQTLPVLPRERSLQLIDKYGITAEQSDILTKPSSLCDYFEEVSKKVNPKKAANYIITELLARFSERQNIPVSANSLSELLSLVEEGFIGNNASKTVLDDMIKTSSDPKSIIERLGLAKNSNQDELLPLCEEILGLFPSEKERYLLGKKNLIGFFVGEAMKRTKGSGDPASLREIFTKLLES
jgi:aspartyl-tRNA(Asn)/glutamyl-tRNA(Gln) amidotransferase subunit B